MLKSFLSLSLLHKVYHYISFITFVLCCDLLHCIVLYCIVLVCLSLQLMDPKAASRPTAAAMVTLANNKLQTLCKKRMSSPRHSNSHSPRTSNSPRSGQQHQAPSSSSDTPSFHSPVAMRQTGTRRSPGDCETTPSPGLAALQQEILRLQQENEVLKHELSQRK